MTSVVRRRQVHDDSGEFSDTSQDKDRNHSDNEGSESDYDSRGSVDSEGSDHETTGNQEAEKRVDHDEDRSNPQYIPKRGTFYEHDDRTASGGEETTTSTADGDKSSDKDGDTKPSDATSERRRGPRKSEACDKWSHDKFNESEQKPKSREELVAIYGYDIRNEEGPPHARRNRKYGRGPNKYTRTWEDEEAYKRQAATMVTNHKKPPNLDEFPELEKSGGQSAKRTSNRKPRPPRSRSQPNNSNESLDNGAQLRRNASIKVTKPASQKQNLANRNVPAKEKMSKVNTSLNRSGPNKSGGDKLPALENLSITTSVNNVGSLPLRKVNVNTVQSQHKPISSVQPSVPAPKRTTTVPTTQQNNTRDNNTRPTPTQQQHKAVPQSTPSTVAETKSGIKRYSSLRQRPLGENYSSQTQHRFAPEYPQQTTSTQSQHQTAPLQQIHPQPQVLHQYHEKSPLPQQVRSPQTSHGPSPPHLTSPHPQTIPIPQSNIQQPNIQQPNIQPPNIPQPALQQPAITQPMQQPIAQQPQISQQQIPQQVRLNIIDQQQMVPHPHTIHNMTQPHSIAQMPPPTQPYPAPAMLPAQYIQGGNTPPVYGNAPMYAQPPPAPYPHQLYQHHNYTTASGVTYYNPAEQEPTPRVPQRRPTAAIPIVKPNNNPNAQDIGALQTSNSSEKDNIDRIVENMFVRKPWPATRGAGDASKEKENRSSQEPNSKESSQSNSLTSSVESRPSAERIEPATSLTVDAPKVDASPEVTQESIGSEEAVDSSIPTTSEQTSEPTTSEA